MDFVVGTPQGGALKKETRFPAPPSPVSAPLALAPVASVVLDQWRGLALLIVLGAHAFDWTGRPGGLARIGVNLFFFISGLLVYRSLAPGPNGMAWTWASAFWRRRLRRLFPALLAYVAFMIPVVFLLEGPDELQHHYLRGAPYVLTFTSNSQSWMPMSLYHLWSLSCELQFYFIAPLLLLAGGSRGIQRLLVWGALLCLAVALGIHPAVSDLSRKNEFAFAVWPLFLGFVAEAVKERLPVISPFLAKIAAAISLAGLAVAAVLLVGKYSSRSLGFVFGTALLPACFCCYRSGLVLGFRAGRFLTWVGKRTYSIYLWQEPLTLCNYLPGLVQPIAALAAIPVGALSYRWLEKPFLSTLHRRPPVQG